MAGTGLILGAFGLVFYLFILLLPIALLVALQVWLCKKSVKLGLILLGLSLALSLLLTISVGLSIGVMTRVGGTLTVRNEETGEIVQQEEYENDWQFEPATLLPVGVVFLVTNIPTVVFGGIWLHYKGRRDTIEDLKRMKIEDLE